MRRIFIKAISLFMILLFITGCQNKIENKNNSVITEGENMHGYKINDDSMLYWLGHDGFKIKTNDKIIYIDPFDINESETADIVLITHAHFDHCSIKDLQKIVGDKTTILATADCTSSFAGKIGGKMQLVAPNKKFNVQGIEIETVPAYNVNKFRSPGVVFHPKENEWVGYIINVSGTRVYHSGDTDFIPEMKNIKTDIALLPVSGTYVMTPNEAAEACSAINPKVAIPMHYNKIVGTIESAEEFKRLSKCKVEII